MGVQQWPLRSVDSDQESLGISAPKAQSSGPSKCEASAAASLHRVGKVLGAGPGCWPEANLERGSPGTWEIRSSPIETRRLGLRLTQAPRARGQSVLTPRELNRWTHDGIAKRRKRSAARWMAGSQSVP